MNTPTTPSSAKPAVERFFYPAAAVLLLVLTVVGFRLFYFEGRAYPGRELTPPIRTLVITHGLAMSAWMLLAVLQPVLVAGGGRRAHMAVGRLAAVFAALVVALGLWIAVASTRAAPPGAMFGPLTAKQFMAVPFLVILLFAIFVAAGVRWRNRPDIHRPMMFLASMTAVGAAISRIEGLNHLYAGTVWQKIFGDLFFTVVIAGAIVLAKMLVFRQFDRWLAAGYGLLVGWTLLIVHGAPTPAWDAVASLFVK